MCAQPGAGGAAKRPFTSDVPRSSRGKALYVVGLTVLGIGLIVGLPGGWLLAMWAFEDHGRVNPALVIGSSALLFTAVACIASGYFLYWAARADRRASGVEEPPRLHVWSAFRASLRERLNP